MANIIINNYCNLKCPYCFAEDIKQSPPHNMDLDEYQKILDFLSKDPERIGVLGGEPTLHPQLAEILNLTFKYCIWYNQAFVLFTNGINLEPFLPQLNTMYGYARILINCNEKPLYNDTNWLKLNAVLDKLFSEEFNIDAAIGCNIYINESEYSHLWDVVEKYQIAHIRASVAAPGGKYYEYRNNKQLYYTLLKKNFMQFISKAQEYNITVDLDCNQIPICFFNTDEINIIKLICNNFLYGPMHCDIPVDILSGGKAIPCFGNYQPIEYDNFNTIEELRSHFCYKINYNAALANNNDMCVDCERHKQFICQGGCLAFSEINRTSS